MELEKVKERIRKILRSFIGRKLTDRLVEEIKDEIMLLKLVTDVQIVFPTDITANIPIQVSFGDQQYEFSIQTT